MKQAMSVVVSLMLIAGPVFAAQQEGYGTNPPPPEFSAAVLSAVHQKFVNLTTEARAGHVRSVTFAEAATAFETFSGHMAELGYTAKMHSWALANKRLWTELNPSLEVMDAGYRAYLRTGVAMTRTHFNQMILGITLSAREQFLKELSNPTIGLAGIHKRIVAGLEREAEYAKSLESKGYAYRLAMNEVPWASLGGTYFSIAMLSMAVMSGGTSVIVFAAIGVGLSAVSLYCGC